MKTCDQREHERFRFEPMYTSVTVRRVQGMRLRTLDGHLYDVSEAGARIELDEPLDVGEEVSVDMAVAAENIQVSMVGRVVWVNDEADDPGPRRMALRFERFVNAADRVRLIRHLGVQGRRAA
ncbi:MAG: PilZ domain-containing protein [Planctomycetes bacterium]|nr:PilZ domain-containing protein [Planctomycetota bacterium]